MSESVTVEKVKQVTPIEQFRATINLMEPQIKMALPAHVPVQKFTRVLITAIQQNQNILSLDRNSVMSSVMKAAQMGLLPDGREGAIVPFKGIATWIPMVSGILKICRNSGELVSICANIIFEKDKFKYYIDSDGEHIEHEPLLFGDRGSIIGTYALAKTKDGGVYVEVMTEAQIQSVRNISRAKEGPWNGPFADEMRKKTAIRRLCKRLPMSTDAQEVIQLDNEEFGLPEQSVHVQQDTKPSSRLSQLVESQAVQTPNEQEPV